MRKAYEPVDNSELDVLVMWPQGTVGFVEEQRVLQLLNHWCQKHGYGRIPELAREIEELWRDPAKAEDFAEQRADHLARVKSCRPKTSNNTFNLSFGD